MNLLNSNRRAICLFIALLFLLPSNISFAARPAEKSIYNLRQIAYEEGLKRSWLPFEKIELGYEPDQVIVKFKKDSVDLLTLVGGEKMKRFVRKNAKKMGPKVIQKMKSKPHKAQKLNSANPKKLETLEENMFREVQKLDFMNAMVLEIAVDEAIEEVMEELRSHPDVEVVSPNHILHSANIPIEDNFTNGNLWGLKNTGATIPGDYPHNNPPDIGEEEDVSASGAWELLEQVSDPQAVVVAVIDSGVDYNHPDLDDNMWNAPNGKCQVPNTNPDIFVSGYTQTQKACPNHGWNFYNPENNEDVAKNPIDTYGHGTLIAGIIAAEADGSGVAGLSHHNTKIMAVKINLEEELKLDDPPANMIDAILAIRFAQLNGADVINASWGFRQLDHDNNPFMLDAIKDFEESGGIFVAGAGNIKPTDPDHPFPEPNHEITPVYPCDYTLSEVEGLDNLICVAATDQAGEITDFSHYGVNTVDIGAPGVNIYSTVPNNGYMYANGTSMAAPFVAGTAAMIMQYRSGLTAAQVKQAIMESGEDEPTLQGKTLTGKRLNVHSALLKAEEIAIQHQAIDPAPTPTIRSKSTPGTWHLASSWEEGRVPAADDIVQLNSAMHIANSQSVKQLIIEPGASLITDTNINCPTLHAEDLINHGLIDENPSGCIGDYTVDVSGKLDNFGIMANEITEADGRLYNEGDITSVYSYVRGDLYSSGIIGNTLTINGPGRYQTIKNTGSIYKLALDNDAYATEDLHVNQLFLGTGAALSVKDGSALHTGYLSNEGIVEGDIVFSGQIFSGGQIDGNVILSSPYDVFLSKHTSVTGNFTVDVNTAFYAKSITGSGASCSGLTIQGSLDNKGDIARRTDCSGTLKIYLHGHLYNTGTVYTLNEIRGMWDAYPSVTEYEIQFSDADLNWQAPAGTGSTHSFCQLYPYISSEIFWRTRPMYGGIPGDWTRPRSINGNLGLLAPEVTLRDPQGNPIADNDTYHLGDITEGRDRTFEFTLQNTGFDDLFVQNITLEAGDTDEFSLLEFPNYPMIPDESEPLILSFDPNGLGEKTVTLLIYSGAQQPYLGHTVHFTANVVEENGSIQQIITAASETAGGLWNQATTWIDELIPDSEDVVEIEGNVILDSSETEISGLQLNPGSILEPGGLQAALPSGNGLLARLRKLFFPNAFAAGETLMLRVDGDIENSGTIQDSAGQTLDLCLSGNLQNTGAMTNSSTCIYWQEEPGAEGYEIQFADMSTGNPEWQEKESLAQAQYSINSLLGGQWIWHVRAIVAGEPQSWSLPHAINAVYILAPELEVTDASDQVIANNTTVQFGQITPEEPIQKVFSLKNIGTRDLDMTGFSITGDTNYTLEVIDGSSLTLEAGEIRIFGINFATLEEDETGTKQAVFTFSSNDGDESSFTLNLNGEALMPNPAPVLAEVTPVPAITTDKTPDYTFSSTEAGTITYDGPCHSTVTNAAEGDTTVTFSLLDSGSYDHCFIIVTDYEGNASDPLPVSPFVIDQVTFEDITWDQIIDEFMLWQIFHAGDFATEEERIHFMEKALGKYNDFAEDEKYPQAAQKARKAIMAGYEDVAGIIDELKVFMADDLDRLKRILIEEAMEEMYE